jgi:light-regulated signal transduction histidine kinase (bacteriophytochrome)
MTARPELSACDREPIHVPGAIQPHGILLVTGPDGATIDHAAGDIEGQLGLPNWLGAPLSEVLGPSVADDVARGGPNGARPAFFGQTVTKRGSKFDVTAHRSGDRRIVELEPVVGDPPSAALLLAQLDAAVASFERTTTVRLLCEAAAVEIRRLTGFDRVMIYQFLDEGAGVVVAEDRRAGMHSFLNHHFPGSDIPRQARALYLRNRVRVIPSVDYLPEPLRPAWTAAAPLDMSDCVLRSVSPVHLQYLRNMNVAASASLSIVKDGALWGLIACHHQSPRLIPYDLRAACGALAGALARQIKAKEDAESYRERIRLRGVEDDLVGLLSREGSLEEVLSHHLPEVCRALGGDGVALLKGDELAASGACPSDPAIRQLCAWVTERNEPLFATERLADHYQPGREIAAEGSGLLALVLSPTEPWIVLWFRAEQAEVIDWAGNPHKGVELGPGETLTPRASFEAWRETVRGRSRRWTIPEIEAASRLRIALLDVRRNRELAELNRRLLTTVREKDLLIQQKQFLIGEVNHRVQNSLQLVSSFLALQARQSDDPGLKSAIEEARRRISAVGLVHKRLYRADEIEVVDASRYVEELCAELTAALVADSNNQLTLDLAPVMLPTDRMIPIGLILTELIINASKYAYRGGPGPIDVSLSEERELVRLVVADKGQGHSSKRQGFGVRMMEALVTQLGGELSYESNDPGLRVTLTAPVGTRSRGAPIPRSAPSL